MHTRHSALQGRREKKGECFDAKLLEEAQNDEEKISAMKYGAGAMTHKVSKMPENNFNFLLMILQLNLPRGSVSPGEFIDHRSHGLEGCVLQQMKPFSSLLNGTRAAI